MNLKKLWCGEIDKTRPHYWWETVFTMEIIPTILMILLIIGGLLMIIFGKLLK